MNNSIDCKKNGLIVAPAGYGKTEHIATQIEGLNTKKKILVLTHTNVGIEELSNRMKKHNIKTNTINIMTIAAFSLKYIRMFPSISGYDKNKDLFDNDIYYQMKKLLQNLHIREVIKNSYDKFFVDEYQDCSVRQHEMIKEICDILDYKIYGDPLQSLYEFDDTPVNLKKIIKKDYELIGELNYPWRWEDKNKRLGQWIQDIRKNLESGLPINLLNIPNVINFIKTNDIDSTLRRIGFEYISKNIPNVILTRFPYQAKKYVKYFSGKYKMQEELECNDLKKFVMVIDENKKEEVLIELFNILKSSYTGLNKYDNIINKIKKHIYDFSKFKKNIELGNIISQFINNQKLNIENIIDIIKLIENAEGIKLCRYELIEVIKQLLNELKINDDDTALNTLQKITANRKQKKFKYLISRVLLVKGLQFENVIVVEPEKMTTKEFYVAISRATNTLTIIATSDIIKFKD